jgi:MoxR-like ATPase
MEAVVEQGQESGALKAVSAGLALTPEQEVVLGKIQEIRGNLNRMFISRRKEVDGLIVAVMAGEHALLLGPPGTAKSALAEALCEAFLAGMPYFRQLMSQFTLPEELFGPFSMPEMKAGNFVRNTTGRLPEAGVGLLDEIFRAKSILNTLLTIVNEKEFPNGGVKPTAISFNEVNKLIDGSLIDLDTEKIEGMDDAQKQETFLKINESIQALMGRLKELQTQDVDQSVPLRTLIGASNSIPDLGEHGALWDRFVLRYWVEDLTENTPGIESVWLRKVDIKYGPNQPRLTASDVEILDELIGAMEVPMHIAETNKDICQRLRANGITASTRRWQKLFDLSKCRALLAGRTDVELRDLAINLPDSLWDKPDSKDMIRKTIEGAINPHGERALEIADAVEKTLEEYAGIVPDVNQITDVDIAALTKQGPKTRKILSDAKSEIKHLLQLDASSETVIESAERVKLMIEKYNKFADMIACKV